MTILLYIIGITISICGMFYVIQNKNKLSNENLVEFEKSIKPKLIKFILLSFIPLFLISAYLLNGTETINIHYFIYAGLANVILSIFGYFQSKKIINQSKNAKCFKYALNYFIYICIGLLFILSAALNTLKEYVNN